MEFLEVVRFECDDLVGAAMGGDAPYADPHGTNQFPARSSERESARAPCAAGFCEMSDMRGAHFGPCLELFEEFIESLDQRGMPAHYALSLTGTIHHGDVLLCRAINLSHNYKISG